MDPQESIVGKDDRLDKIVALGSEAGYTAREALQASSKTRGWIRAGQSTRASITAARLGNQLAKLGGRSWHLTRLRGTPFFARPWSARALGRQHSRRPWIPEHSRISCATYGGNLCKGKVVLDHDFPT
jgi:hypothetical protein